MEILGIVVFAVGILVSIALHEAGHMSTARAFGMKVTRFFVGFGPTLWSFRRGDTEYGVKGVPLGAFVKIVGMTPQDDDVAPGDEHRAMWRYPVWKRTIVMSAGSVTHFAFGMIILWGMFAFLPLPDDDRTNAAPAVVSEVITCVAPKWEFDPATGQSRDCVEGTDPAAPATLIGLRAGDRITAINGVPAPSWVELTERIRASGGQNVTVTYERDGQVITSPEVTIPTAERPKRGLAPMAAKDLRSEHLERVGVLGITPVEAKVAAGPGAAFGLTWDQTVGMFVGTFEAMKKFPEKLPKLWGAITGEPRDPETPISVVGASRIGGELFAKGEIPYFLALLAALNFFVGVFNLLPLLPLDGGHIAIAWFEKARSWLYARLGRRDPGRVDYYKLMPVTYAVILIFGAFTLLTVAADIVNPIRLF
jgi:membrane-associated protease RseP (regulator of RpoE activity)